MEENSTTYYNVIIAVVSLFILLIKGIMFITHLFDPLISTLIHAALTAIYAVSIRNQTAPDMSDPDHPQPGAPWYITKSCGPPVSPHLKNYCTQAKACFAVTILLVYVLHPSFLPLHSPPKTYHNPMGTQRPLHNIPPHLPNIPLPNRLAPCQLIIPPSRRRRISAKTMGNDECAAHPWCRRGAEKSGYPTHAQDDGV